MSTRQPLQLEILVNVALRRTDGRTSGSYSFDVQLRIYNFYSPFLMDFPGCILAGVSSAGFIGTMADNKSFKQMMRFTKKRLLDCYGKAKPGKSERRAARALFCVFLLSALLFSCGGEKLKHRVGSELCHITGSECTLFLLRAPSQT